MKEVLFSVGDVILSPLVRASVWYDGMLMIRGVCSVAGC